jgi:hypothetical protein
VSGGRVGWHKAWELHARSGSAHHLETGLCLLARPRGCTMGGMVEVGSCHIEAAVHDRRRADAVSPDDPNAPGVAAWGLWAVPDGPHSLPAALQVLAGRMPAPDAAKALQRLLREAGMLWVYRARLDRERPRAQPPGEAAAGVSAS